VQQDVVVVVLGLLLLGRLLLGGGDEDDRLGRRVLEADGVLESLLLLEGEVGGRLEGAQQGVDQFGVLLQQEGVVEQLVDELGLCDQFGADLLDDDLGEEVLAVVLLEVVLQHLQ
jgi:hypothetical protein